MSLSECNCPKEGALHDYPLVEFFSRVAFGNATRGLTECILHSTILCKVACLSIFFSIGVPWTLIRNVLLFVFTSVTCLDIPRPVYTRTVWKLRFQSGLAREYRDISRYVVASFSFFKYFSIKSFLISNSAPLLKITEPNVSESVKLWKALSLFHSFNRLSVTTQVLINASSIPIDVQNAILHCFLCMYNGKCIVFNPLLFWL